MLASLKALSACYCQEIVRRCIWPEGEERGASLSAPALSASSSALPPSPQTQLPQPSHSAKAHQLRLHSVSSGQAHMVPSAPVLLQKQLRLDVFRSPTDPATRPPSKHISVLQTAQASYQRLRIHMLRPLRWSNMTASEGRAFGGRLIRS